MEFRHRAAYIKNAFKHPGYLFIALGVAALYILANLLVTIYIHGSIEAFYRSMFPSYTVPFTILVIISGTFVGINAALLVEKFNELRLKTAGVGITGILFGSLAAGCPGCFFGLFPVLLSLFGISATLAILPFNGLELQVFAILLLLWSIYTLATETQVACEIRPKRPRRETI